MKMNEFNSIHIIICEGTKSEVAYIAELNRYLRDLQKPISLISRPVGNGDYTAVVRKYKEEFKRNKKGNFFIWVDKDIYKRNNRGNADKYSKKPTNIPDFYFNIFNFEDFLILHCLKNVVLKYQNLCNKSNHFDIPLYERDYMLLIQQIFNHYSKSSLPNGFEISKEVLENLFNNNNDTDIKFSSDFARELKNIIQNDV